MSQEPITTTIQQTPQLLLMRAKYPTLKQKLNQSFPYFYQLEPKDQQMYNNKQIQLTNKLKENPQVIDLGSSIIIIMGKIQGMSAEYDLKIQLPKIFSYDNKQFWDALIKQKCSTKWLGQPKQKSYSIYQIKDIQQLKQIYDVQQIKKQRKLIKQYSTMYKSICKFVQKYDKLKSTQQIAQLYQQYKKTQQQQSKMMKLLNGDKNKGSNNKNNKAEVPIKNMTKDEVKMIQNNDAVQEMKNQNNEINNKMDIQEQQRKVQNNQIQCNRICTSTVNQQKQKPMDIQQPKQTKQNEEKKSKKKTQPKQQTSSKKQPKVVVDKQQQMMSKYKSLDLFFKKKKADNEQPQQNTQKSKQQQKQNEMQNQVIPQQKMDKTDIFLSYITQTKIQKPSIESLKSQFTSTKKVIIKQFTTCYVNIVMKRSRLQYYNFQINQLKADFINPQIQKQNIRYDDSSDQYSQLVADSINQQMIQQQQQQQQQQQSNSAIVSDSYCQYKSSHVFSSEDQSEQQQQNKIKPQFIKNIGKWFFNKQQQNKQKYNKYDIISLIQDIFPIIVRQQIQQSNNDVTPIQKIQMYKQIHGSYTPKDILIKKLNTIVENKITMNKLSTMIKDICEKKGNQRVIKSEIIKEIAEEMTQLSPNLQAQLQQLRLERQNVRNQQAQAKREQKMNQKDQKIQKLIQQYEGIMTTNAILEYLRNKEMKMIKQDLNALIKVKQGQKWEHIRNQIKKSKLIKGNKQKVPKTLKANKNEQLLEQIKNSHRPIEQIMKQNQIDMANRPKKEKKIRKQMVNQGEGEVEVQMQEQNQQQAQLDVDDQSYEVKQKPMKKKSSKGKKGKKIIFKMDVVLPTRRNPNRNKRKNNKYNEKKQNQQQKMENEKDNQEKCDGEKEQSEKNQQGQNSNCKQNNEQNNHNEAKQVQSPRSEECNQEMIEEKSEIKQQNKIQSNNQAIESQNNNNHQQLKQQSSPIKNPQKTPINQKSSSQKDQKTANKISTSDQKQMLTQTPM